MRHTPGSAGTLPFAAVVAAAGFGPGKKRHTSGSTINAEPDSATGLDDVETRFELDVDGVPVSMLTDVQSEAGVPVRKTDIAEFPSGLPSGWHDLTGRWYDGGRLILSSRAAIEFVEP